VDQLAGVQGKLEVGLDREVGVVLVALAGGGAADLVEGLGSAELAGASPTPESGADSNANDADVGAAKRVDHGAEEPVAAGVEDPGEALGDDALVHPPAGDVEAGVGRGERPGRGTVAR
jgi:hypothetical protein